MTGGSAQRILGSIGVLVLLAAVPAAAHEGHGATESVRIAELQNIELGELAGKRASMVRVTFQPGAASPPHRHPGTVIVYVLEGEIRSALNDEQGVTYHAGESWTEPVGTLHRVAVNTSDKAAVLLAILLHDAEDALQQPAE